MVFVLIFIHHARLFHLLESLYAHIFIYYLLLYIRYLPACRLGLGLSIWSWSSLRLVTSLTSNKYYVKASCVNSYLFIIISRTYMITVKFIFPFFFNFTSFIYLFFPYPPFIPVVLVFIHAFIISDFCDFGLVYFCFLSSCLSSIKLHQETTKLVYFPP